MLLIAALGAVIMGCIFNKQPKAPAVNPGGAPSYAAGYNANHAVSAAQVQLQLQQQCKFLTS